MKDAFLDFIVSENIIRFANCEDNIASNIF